MKRWCRTALRFSRFAGIVRKKRRDGAFLNPMEPAGSIDVWPAARICVCGIIRAGAKPHLRLLY